MANFRKMLSFGYKNPELTASLFCAIAIAVVLIAIPVRFGITPNWQTEMPWRHVIVAGIFGVVMVIAFGCSKLRSLRIK